MASITDMEPGDYVKVGDGRYEKITEIYGVKGEQLAKPSEGGFGVKTESGRTVSMWAALGYAKKEDIERKDQV